MLLAINDLFCQININPAANLSLQRMGHQAEKLPNGDILIYSKAVPGLPWSITQRIAKPFTTIGTDVWGDVLAMSADGTWFAVGSPSASDVPLSTTVSQLYTVDRTGVSSGLTNQGIVSLYKKDNAGLFSLVTTFTSPDADDNELFGSNLAFGNNVLFISAVGRNNNAGRVYQVNYKNN